MIEVAGTTGQSEIFKNMDRLVISMSHYARQGLEEAGIHLRDKAIEQLIRTSTSPYLSVDNESIADKNNWTIVRQADNHIIVNCTSKHGPIVEFGGIGKVIARRTKNKLRGFPIGRQQGAGDTWRASFTLQTPKKFFRTTIESPDVKKELTNIVGYNVKKSIRKEF